MKEMGGWSPSPHLLDQPLQASCVTPHALRRTYVQGSFWCMDNCFGRAVQHTWVGFFRLRPNGYAELTERRSRLVGPGSPMKHGRYAEFSKQTFLPGKTIAR